eukprot:jgi/Hompol1/1360/HPOL_004765-RA
MAEPTTPPPTTASRLQRMVLSLQFVWFLGHLMTESPAYYRAFYGTIISYGIILFKTYGAPKFSTEYAQRVLRDENTQYFMLAAIWTTSAPLFVALVPYAVFSLIHTLNFARNELIPNLLGANNPSATALSTAIGKLVQSSHTRAIYFVANTEVWVIMPMTIIAIFISRGSFFTPIVFAQFLSFRYAFSPVSKQVFAGLNATLDTNIANNMALPEWLRSGFRKVRELVIQYGDLEARARQQAQSARAASSTQ